MVWALPKYPSVDRGGVSTLGVAPNVVIAFGVVFVTFYFTREMGE